MNPCTLLALLAVACFFVCGLLLVHHKVHHSDKRNPEAYIDDECEQWFQWRLHPEGDVCNFQSCSHEMWCLFLALLGGVMLVVSAMMQCAA